MSYEFETLYHGTTVDRLELIQTSAVLPMHREDTGLTGAWMTRLLEKSLQHASERGASAVALNLLY
jgi:RNA:NAD 2'-phosphotransferase (TPT1/KptA family)